MSDKIIFEIGVNGAAGVKTIAQLKDELVKLKKEASTTDVGSAAFKSLQNNIAGVNGELKNLNQGFKAIDAKNIAPVANTMAAIKQEVKDLKKELEGKQLGSKEFDQLQAKLQTANAKFREFKEDIRGFKPEEVLKGVASLGASIAGSFSVAQGVLSAFGVESKAVADAEKKAQAAIAIALGASTIAREVDSTSKLVASGKSKLLAASTALESTATNGSTVARYAATVAQKALNAAMNANPIAVVLISVAALTAAFIAFSSGSNSAAESQEKLNKQLEEGKRITEIFNNTFKDADAQRQAENKRTLALLDARKAKEQEVLAEKNRQLEADKIGAEASLKYQLENVNNAQEIKRLKAEIYEIDTQILANGEKINQLNKEEKDAIKQKAEKSAKEQSKISLDELDKRLKKENEMEKEAKSISLQNKLDSLESEKASIQEITDAKIAILQDEQLNKTEGLEEGSALRFAIEQKYTQAIIALKGDLVQNDKDAQTLLLQNKLDAIEQSEKIDGVSFQSITDTTNAKIALLQDQQLKETAGLEEGSAARYEIEKKYTNLIIALKGGEVDAKGKLEKTKVQNELKLAADLSSGLASIAKKGSDEQKALTLTTIALNTAIAIAGAVAVATKSASNPYEEIAGIAAGIAAVLAGIGQAKQVLSTADNGYADGGYVTNNRNRKNYSDGGAVYGAGTSTSDSIPARLSNGEYVVKASAVSNYGKSFFDNLNSLKFANGGYVSSNIQSSPAGASISQLEDIKAILLNQNDRPIKTYVTDRDMTDQQKETAIIERRARF